MNAIWFSDFDMHTDSVYRRPGCPECEAPIGKDEDGVYRCYSCGGAVNVRDPEMIEWFRARAETKTETEPCFRCRGLMDTVYVRNLVTLAWQAAHGQCRNCGARFIV